MRFNKVGKATRLAMGKTQKEMAEMIEISTASISNFEIGNELTKPVYEIIKRGYTGLLEGLRKEEYMQKQILIQAYLLNEENLTKSERREICSWTLLYMSKYQMELEKNIDNTIEFRAY